MSRITSVTVARLRIEKIADFEARQADDEVSISPDFGYDEDENGELLNTEDLIGNKLKIHLADMVLAAV